MQDIHPLYYNNFGIAFKWKADLVRDTSKIQMVFRDTGLLLSKDELRGFSKKIKYCISNACLCADCSESDCCKTILLDTPAHQLTLAMNKSELIEMDDLVAGALFELELSQLLKF